MKSGVPYYIRLSYLYYNQKRNCTFTPLMSHVPVVYGSFYGETGQDPRSFHFREYFKLSSVINTHPSVAVWARGRDDEGRGVVRAPGGVGIAVYSDEYASANELSRERVAESFRPLRPLYMYLPTSIYLYLWIHKRTGPTKIVVVLILSAWKTRRMNYHPPVVILARDIQRTQRCSPSFAASSLITRPILDMYGVKRNFCNFSWVLVYFWSSSKYCAPTGIRIVLNFIEGWIDIFLFN